MDASSPSLAGSEIQPFKAYVDGYPYDLISEQAVKETIPYTTEYIDPHRVITDKINIIYLYKVSTFYSSFQISAFYG